jgi:hypothetical protein
MNKNLIILLLIIASMVILSGCVNNAPAKEPTTMRLIKSEDVGSWNIEVFHDDQYNVTCWTNWAYYKGGISCMSDSQLNIGK